MYGVSPLSNSGASHFPYTLATPAKTPSLFPESQGANAENSNTTKAKSPAQQMEDANCDTCEGRRYQDQSNDPGVSFQSPQHIDPSQSARTVRAHEMEHVVHSQVKARMEGKEVVSQSVVLHNAICPECGRIYVSGGVTKTSTRTQMESAFQVGLHNNQETGRTLNRIA